MMTSKNLPVWIYAGPLAGTVVVLMEQDALFAEAEQFGEILRDGNPKNGVSGERHPAAEAFYADRQAQVYRDRQMRSRAVAAAGRSRSGKAKGKP